MAFEQLFNRGAVAKKAAEKKEPQTRFEGTGMDVDPSTLSADELPQTPDAAETMPGMAAEAAAMPAAEQGSARSKWEAVDPVAKRQFMELLTQRQELEINSEKSKTVFGRLKNWFADKNVRHAAEISNIDNQINAQHRELVSLHEALLNEDPNLRQVEHEDYKIDANYVRSFLKQFFDQYNYSTETAAPSAELPVAGDNTGKFKTGDLVSVKDQEGKLVQAEIADQYEDGSYALTYADEVGNHKIGDEVMGAGNLTSFAENDLQSVAMEPKDSWHEPAVWADGENVPQREARITNEKIQAAARKEKVKGVFERVQAKSAQARENAKQNAQFTPEDEANFQTMATHQQEETDRMTEQNIRVEKQVFSRMDLTTSTERSVPEKRRALRDRLVGRFAFAAMIGYALVSGYSMSHPKEMPVNQGLASYFSSIEKAQSDPQRAETNRQWDEFHRELAAAEDALQGENAN